MLRLTSACARCYVASCSNTTATLGRCPTISAWVTEGHGHTNPRWQASRVFPSQDHVPQNRRPPPPPSPSASFSVTSPQAPIRAPSTLLNGVMFRPSLALPPLKLTGPWEERGEGTIIRVVLGSMIRRDAMTGAHMPSTLEPPTWRPYLRTDRRIDTSGNGLERGGGVGCHH